MSCYNNSTRLHINTRKVWKLIWYTMGTMHSSRLPMRAKAHIYRLWYYYRPYLGGGGWSGKVLVWPWRLNPPFTHHRYNLLAISSGRKPYKSHSRCVGIATMTCGA